ncbi:MAG: hypothetical protein IPF54_15760 [Draconibacterium sp.]|nr:hypothetical protein [Draconibacterium sp.]
MQVYGGWVIWAKCKNAGITIPFAITEYGPIGHWERPQTAWGREIEETSAQKATGLYDRIQRGIVNDPTGLCLVVMHFVGAKTGAHTNLVRHVPQNRRSYCNC